MSVNVLGFSGKWRPFSNFWQAPVLWGDYITPVQIWDCNEIPYQLAKTLNPTERAYAIAKYRKPGDIRNWGRDPSLCTIRDDWKDPLNPYCLKVMSKLVIDKFKRNPDLLQLLFSTGDGYLEETNTWNDTFFGVCNGIGSNFLGKILMTVRNKLSEGTLEGIVKCPGRLC